MEEDKKEIRVSLSTVLLLIAIVVIVVMGVYIYKIRNYNDNSKYQANKESINEENSMVNTMIESKNVSSFEELMKNLYRRENTKFNDIREIDYDYYISYDDEKNNLLGAHEFSLSAGSDDRFLIQSRLFNNNSLSSNYIVVTDFPEKIVDQIIKLDKSEGNEDNNYSSKEVPIAQILLLTESGSVYHAENIRLESEEGTFYSFNNAPFKIEKYDKISKAIKITEAAFNEYEDDFLPVDFLVTTYEGDLYRCNGEKIIKIEE